MGTGRWLLATGLWRLVTGYYPAYASVLTISENRSRVGYRARRDRPARWPALHFSKLKNRIWREAEDEYDHEHEDDKILQYFRAYSSSSSSSKTVK
jgi:hypothetical protein